MEADLETGVPLEIVEVEEVQPESVEVVELSFEQRVDRLVEMQLEDPTVTARMLAEMYIFVNEFERAQRTMMEGGGPMAMLKMLMKGGG